MGSGSMPTGMRWVFRAAGLAIVIFGVYLAGGDELRCRRAGPGTVGGVEGASLGSPAAECRVETRRWLGTSVVGESAYRGITKAETIRVPQQGERAEDAWFVGLFAGDQEVGRVYARRREVQAACDRLRTWVEGGLRGEVHFGWSTWPFGSGAMAFGLVWLILLTRMTRAEQSA